MEQSRAAAPAKAPTLRERKKRATRQALRRAALRTVLERGLDQATVDDISAAAGVSRRTFFNYFASREQALASFDPESAEQMVADLGALDPALPLVDALRERLTEWVHELQEDAELIRLRRQVARRWPAFAGQTMQDNTELLGRVTQALQRARPQSDPFEVSVVVGVVAAVVKVCVAHQLGSGDDIDHTLERGFAVLGGLDQRRARGATVLSGGDAGGLTGQSHITR